MRGHNSTQNKRPSHSFPTPSRQLLLVRPNRPPARHPRPRRPCCVPRALPCCGCHLCDYLVSPPRLPASRGQARDSPGHHSGLKAWKTSGGRRPVSANQRQRGVLGKSPEAERPGFPPERRTVLPGPPRATRPRQPLTNGHPFSLPPVALAESVPALLGRGGPANLRDSGGESEGW